MADRRGRRDTGKGKQILQPWGSTRRRSKSITRPLIIISSSDSDKEKEPIVISSSDSDDNEAGFTDQRPAPSSSSTKPSVAKKKLEDDEIKLPAGAKLVADCDAADIMQGIEARLESLKNLHITIPKSFPKSLQYSKEKAVKYRDRKPVKRALESLKEYGVTDWEICMIANSAPESCEEAYALIPSLKDKEDRVGDALNAVLAILEKFKVEDD